MSNERDPHRRYTNSTEYTGHQLLSYHDVVYSQDVRPDGNDNPPSPIIEDALDTATLNEAEIKIGSHLLANCALGIVGILFLFCLIGLIPPVSCGLRLCNKTDRSVNARLFAFIAPLQHAWGAFTAGIGGIFVACVHLFFLRTLSLGHGSSILTAIRMRKGIRAYLRHEHIVKIVISLLIFVFIGFAASWLTGASFLLGILITLFTGWVSLYIATYGGLCILSGADKSFQDAAEVMFRSATTIGVLSVSLGVTGVGLGYLIFRDIRSLLGLAAGISTIALISRVASGIYSAATAAATQTIRRVEFDMPTDDPRNYAVVSSKIGDNLDGATGVGVDFLESITAAIAVSAISATSLPYVPADPFVFCVYNNLHIDFGCIAYGNTTQTVSLAGEICRQNRFYTQFPSLSFSQSNSLFAAVPFLTGILGLLIVTICSIRLIPLNTDQLNNQFDITNRMRRVVRIQTVIAALLFLIGSVAISYGLFGPHSSFQRAFSSNAFPRREFTSSKVLDKCVPVRSSIGVGTEGILPQLNNSVGDYRATNELGETFPLPSQVPWRMLIVLLTGQMLGFLLEVLIMFFCDSVYVPTSTIAKMGECGIEDVIAQGLGSALTSTVLPFMLTLSAAHFCHYLLGGYGIALASVSMLAASGVTFVIGIFEPLAKNSEGISEFNRSSTGIRSAIDVLGRIGSHYSLSSRGLYASSALLVVISLASDLLLVSKLVPTAKDIIGSIDSQFQRHIRSIDTVTAIDPNVVVSVMVGVLLPMVFIGLPLLGMARTAYAIIVAARREIRQPPDSANDDGLSGLKEYVQLTTRHAVFEMLLPVFIVIVAPISIGFGLGQRGLVGFLLSTSSCAYLLSMLFMTTGSSWKNACKVEKEKSSGGNQEAHMFRLRAVSIADNVGQFLSRTSSPGLAVFMKIVSLMAVFGARLMKPDNSLWYIGFSILAFTAIMSFIMLVASYKHQKKIRTEARLQFDNQASRPGRREGVPDDSGTLISPFYEDGVLVARRNLISSSPAAVSSSAARGMKEE